MKTFINVLICLQLIIFIGCASKRKGFNRGALQNSMNQVVVTDKNIEQTLHLKPQLPKKFKLGVYFSQLRKTGYSGPYLRWTPEDKESFEDLEKELLETGRVSKVVLINDATVTEPNLKSVRLAAAQHGLDAVMIISGAYQFNMYPNYYAWSYLAVAPAFFVNGNVSESIVINRATMWDVRNQYLYMTAETEELNIKTHPALIRDSKKMATETKRQAIGNLKAEIKKQFSEML